MIVLNSDRLAKAAVTLTFNNETGYTLTGLEFPSARTAVLRNTTILGNCQPSQSTFPGETRTACQVRYANSPAAMFDPSVTWTSQTHIADENGAQQGWLKLTSAQLDPAKTNISAHTQYQ